MELFKSLGEKLKNIAKNKHGLYIMSFICLFEPVFVPIFPELAIIPLALARPKDRYKIYFIALTLTCLGTAIGYSLGYYLSSIIIKLFFSESTTIQTFTNYLNDYGLLLPLLGSMLPFPLKFISIACGLGKINFFLTILAVFIGRGVRFGMAVFLSANSMIGWQKKHHQEEK